MELEKVNIYSNLYPDGQNRQQDLGSIRAYNTENRPAERAGKVPCRMSNTRNNHLLMVLTTPRKPCTHKTTGKHLLASFQAANGHTLGSREWNLK